MSSSFFCFTNIAIFILLIVLLYSTGRKASDRHRERSNKEPDIVIDRLNREQGEPPAESSISFKDPREKAQKEYELHLRSKLPSTVSKCRGKCGKKISTDDVLVVRSYGNVSWTDKKTGELKQRYGPMYIHFKEECLKAFSDVFYAPGDSFDFSVIVIDAKSKAEMSKADVVFLQNMNIR